MVLFFGSFTLFLLNIAFSSYSPRVGIVFLIAGFPTQGKDATRDFKDIGHSASAQQLMAPLKIGTVSH